MCGICMVNRRTQLLSTPPPAHHARCEPAGPDTEPVHTVQICKPGESSGTETGDVVGVKLAPDGSSLGFGCHDGTVHIMGLGKASY